MSLSANTTRFSMFRRARHLIAFSLFLLLLTGAAAISRPADATRLIGFLSELNGQGQATQERERELQLVQEVVSQVLDNYVLALDPVRLVVAAIEGMSSAADGERIIAERLGDAVRLQAGEASVGFPLSREGRRN